VGFAALAVIVALSNFLQLVLGDTAAPLEAFLNPLVWLVLAVGLLAGVTGIADAAPFRAFQVGAFLLTGLLSALDASPGNLTSAIFVLVSLALYWAYGFPRKYTKTVVAAVTLLYFGALTYGYQQYAGYAFLDTIGAAMLIGFLFLLGMRLWALVLERERDRQKQLEREVEKQTRELRKAVEERGVLIKEIHHRVKNNLQLVSSFLNLSRSGLSSKSATEVIRESQYRVRAIAMVHERLYRSESFAGIDLANYVESLVKELRHAFGCDMSFTSSLPENFTVSIDFAVPFGLIINELLTNAVSHAEGCPSRIHVAIHAEQDSVNATVSDSGPGFRADEKGDTDGEVGFQIVYALMNQLDGTANVDSGPSGTTWHISAPHEGGAEE
jgi:two-component sensor histidine kinase